MEPLEKACKARHSGKEQAKDGDPRDTVLLANCGTGVCLLITHYLHVLIVKIGILIATLPA